jgi:hypothetical protein
MGRLTFSETSAIRPTSSRHFYLKTGHILAPKIPEILESSFYRDNFYLVDEITALRFTAAGAPLAEERIRILPMN